MSLMDYAANYTQTISVMRRYRNSTRLSGEQVKETKATMRKT